MATNKNQHFVPRCYLRPFTVDKANLAINLYNLDRKKIVRNAPVKNQCSGDYFYGKDLRLESWLQQIESSYAITLRRISEPGYVLSPEDGALLRWFWLLQYFRTEAASRRAVEMTNAYSDLLGETGQPYRLEIKQAVQFAMEAFFRQASVMDDMRVCLIRNKTATPFIASDDPAVLTNRWQLTSRKTRGLSFGLASAGAMMLLPVSPEILFLAYDADVYGLTSDEGWHSISREEDVIAFNQHQLLNCSANIYLSDLGYSTELQRQHELVSSLRPAARHRVNYAVLETADSGYEKYRVVTREEAEAAAKALVHTQAVFPKAASWPSQMRLRHKGVYYTNGSGVGLVRERHARIESDGGNPYRRERI